MAQRGPSRAHARLLGLLLGCFCFRVLAQLAAAWIAPTWLPPFEAWQSGALAYPALLGGQFAILLLCGWTARGIASGRTRPRADLGRPLLIAGGLYGALMAARLVLGATLLVGSPWWCAPIPSVFHLVLAGFLIVAGHYHVAQR